MPTQIFESYKEFLNRSDKSVNGVSAEFANQYPDYVKDNETNTGCWNCRNCNYCENCENCEYCVDCDYCWNCEDCESCECCESRTSCKFRLCRKDVGTR